jgi:glutamine synthetase
MSTTVNKDAVRERMRNEGIEFILVQFVDIHGSVKVKQVPVH